MSYNSLIPQPGDLISVSQGDLLNNFTSMQSTYTTDHYGFNPTANIGFHKHVTMGNDPANIPTPAAGFGSEFAKTVNGATYPFWVRDNLATQYPSLPIKAYALFTAANPPVSTFTLPYANVASITRVSNSVYEVNFVDAFPNTNYGALANIQFVGNFLVSVTATAVNKATVRVLTTAGGPPADTGALITVAFLF